jgi:8-oxo-dGTP pyrophosphatase MutT (NUDIX family)
VERHFTVSGFVTHQGRTALHWHRLGLWLPPGGHIEPNEDPVQAVVREVLEETGIAVEVVPTATALGHREPVQLPPPVTIGVYDIPADSGNDHPHQHIDFVYFTRPVAGADLALPDGDEGWAWLDETALRSGAPLARPGDGGETVAVPADVRGLALASIAAVRDLDASLARSG